MNIVYCDRCGIRVPSDASAPARGRGDGQFLCSACAAAQLPKNAPQRPPSSTRTGTKLYEKHRTKTQSQPVLLALAGVGVLIAGVSVVLLTRASNSVVPAVSPGSPPVRIASAPTVPPSHAPVPTPTPTQTQNPAPSTRTVPTTTPPTPPTPPTQPTPAAPSPVSPVTSGLPPKVEADPSSIPDLENNIQTIAASYLAEARTVRQSDPDACKEKLTRIVTTYRSTPASAQAAQLLAELNAEEKTKARELPANPAPALTPQPLKGDDAARRPAGDTVPIFDGKTLDFLDPECVGSWKVETGVIVNRNSDWSGGQSRAEYSDGVLHFSFECTAADGVEFLVRQGSGASYKVAFSKSDCAGLAGKRHELIFTCDGATVTALLDGKPAPVAASAQPRSGRFKFNVDHGTLRVFEIGMQKLGAK